MKIYEKIFSRLEEINMSQVELARKTGIATSTISDWRKKKINPQADKLVAICKALDISLADLLCDQEDSEQLQSGDYVVDETYVLEHLRKLNNSSLKKLFKYFEFVDTCGNDDVTQKQRKVSVIQDIDGNNIVVINDIRFKGKRSVDWDAVKDYLKEFIGDFYVIPSTGDSIYIGTDLPNEYTGSKYTHTLKGANAKAKANASQGIPEIIGIAMGKSFRENNEDKHWRDAKYGWYRYNSRFALPVYNESGEIERYNVFHTALIVRHSEDGKLYLYDLLDIKKETSNPIEQ